MFMCFILARVIPGARHIVIVTVLLVANARPGKLPGKIECLSSNQVFTGLPRGRLWRSKLTIFICNGISAKEKKMKKQTLKFKMLTVAGCLFCLVLSACGGGGSDGGGGTTTSTGYLKDSNVSGLHFVSGSQSGTTGVDGSFIYEVGKTVTFSLGGVTIGTATGKKVVTPVNFVTSGSTSSLEVQNIVRFLMLLDEDGVPENGIIISPAVSALAENWAAIDFSATDFAAELAAILTEVGTALPGAILPDAVSAQDHLEATMRCSYAGAYKGTYSGDSTGQFGVLIDAQSGFLVGVTYDPSDFDYRLINGIQEMSYGQSVSVSGDVSNGSIFTGNFTSVDRVSGTWINNIYGYSGSFRGSRIGGAVDAQYRFTGRFSGTDYGLFTFDIDSSNNITGLVYSVTEDQMLTLNSGSVSGNSLTATTSDGTLITGTIDLANGTLFGNWNWNSIDFGTFDGSGCRLN